MDRTGTERTIGHDEFDPIGTLALIVLYFVVLTLMWLFTYFVEFLGNEPTVTGVLTPGVNNLPAYAAIGAPEPAVVGVISLL